MTNTTIPQTLPDLLMSDFQDAALGLTDIDIYEVLHGIIADVLDSARLALREHPDVTNDTVTDVMNTVEDYVANNYGDR